MSKAYTYKRLDISQVNDVIVLNKLGFSNSSIGAAFGYTPKSIQYIVEGKSHKAVVEDTKKQNDFIVLAGGIHRPHLLRISRAARRAELTDAQWQGIRDLAKQLSPKNPNRYLRMWRQPETKIRRIPVQKPAGADAASIKTKIKVPVELIDKLVLLSVAKLINAGLERMSNDLKTE